MDALSNQYSLIAEDYEGITYNDKKMGWEQLAKDFVYTQQNPRVQRYIELISTTKVEQEFQLKFKLEKKFLGYNTQRLHQIFGKELTRKLKVYISNVIQSYQDQLSQVNHQDALDKKMKKMVSFAKIIKEETAKLKLQPIKTMIGDEPDWNKTLNSLKHTQHENFARVPLLHYKNDDEMHQIVKFMLIYYEPILSQMEKTMLEKFLDEEAQMRIRKHDMQVE